MHGGSISRLFFMLFLILGTISVKKMKETKNNCCTRNWLHKQLKIIKGHLRKVSHPVFIIIDILGNFPTLFFKKKLTTSNIQNEWYWEYYKFYIGT